jgi:sulfite reductase (NADPH) hemoprotein beta-component
VPYGLLSSAQLRKLADIADTYDRGYAHLTTRQNVQFNWPALERVPDLLAELASVQMHAIQTSGNCIRNTTTDQFAGVADDEWVNPFVWAELIRQWSTFHPEFAFLPRKFKIAISGSEQDRAAVKVHDIGLQALEHAGRIGFTVYVGGGLGRTPLIGHQIAEFIEAQDLLTFLDAILRTYNRYGRRDNKYKARIKILVKETKPEEFRAAVFQEWESLRGGPGTITKEQLERVTSRFTTPVYRDLTSENSALEAERNQSPAFARWLERNVRNHVRAGYKAVTLSVKKAGVPPGDLTSAQMREVAALADEFSFGELRITHEQNLVLADVEMSQLPALWKKLREAHLATPNIGLLTNIIACPGGDFCSLANAVSIPVALAIAERFDDLDTQFHIGELDLNISGCINACGHHHVGHIGILGVDKAGEEWYQITIGGRQGNRAAIGKIIGRSVSRAEVPDVVERLIETYLELRHSPQETFADAVGRLGLEPFKEAVYANAN